MFFPGVKLIHNEEYYTEGPFDFRGLQGFQENDT